jgi:hypothetical protein
MKKIHENEALLYVLIVIAIIQLLYYVVNHKFKSFLFFCIIGVVLKLFIKSTSVVLILDLIITNVLMTSFIKNEGFRRREGIENMPSPLTDAQATEPGLTSDKTSEGGSKDSKDKQLLTGNPAGGPMEQPAIPAGVTSTAPNETTGVGGTGVSSFSNINESMSTITNANQIDGHLNMLDKTISRVEGLMTKADSLITRFSNKNKK